MCLQRSSKRVEWKSRPSKPGWKVVPQSRTGSRETPVAKFVVCSWHKQLPDVVGMRPQRATTRVRQKMTVVSKIRCSSTSERLMHKPRDLERDSLMNWQPVQLPQHWCDVIAWDQASGSVLHRLKALKKSVTDTIKQWITVVQATRDECLDKRLGGIHGQRTDYIAKSA